MLRCPIDSYLIQPSSGSFPSARTREGELGGGGGLGGVLKLGIGGLKGGKGLGKYVNKENLTQKVQYIKFYFTK